MLYIIEKVVFPAKYVLFKVSLFLFFVSNKIFKAVLVEGGAINDTYINTIIEQKTTKIIISHH